MAKTNYLLECKLSQLLSQVRASRGVRLFRDPVVADYSGDSEFELADTGSSTIQLSRTSPAGKGTFLMVRTNRTVNFTLTGTGVSYSGAVDSTLILTQPGMDTLTLTGIAGQGAATISIIFSGVNS